MTLFKLSLILALVAFVASTVADTYPRYSVWNTRLQTFATICMFAGIASVVLSFVSFFWVTLP